MPLSPSRKTVTDQEILENLSKGNNRSRGEEQLFEAFVYFIPQATQKYHFSEEESFTIYSDTILAVIPQLSNGAFERRSSLKTWVYQVFHHKCVDLVRKKTTNKSRMQQSATLTGMLEQVADTAKSIVQEMMEKTDRQLIQQKLAEIGSNCQQLLLLWADGFSDKEIAGSMEYKTASVVKTSRLRCLEKLKQLYKEDKTSPQ